MREHFIVESTAEKFVRDEMQTYLIRYAKGRPVRLPVSCVLGLLLVASGIYTLVTNGLDAIIWCLVLAGLGVFLVWAELTGWEIRRAVKSSRKDSPSESSGISAESVFRFEFDGDHCRFYVDGSQRGATELKDLSLVQETDHIFLAAAKNSAGVFVPKDSFVEGTPDEFREYICARAKKYEFVRVTERMLSFLK